MGKAGEEAQERQIDKPRAEGGSGSCGVRKQDKDRRGQFPGKGWVGVLGRLVDRWRRKGSQGKTDRFRAAPGKERTGRGQGAGGQTEGTPGSWWTDGRRDGHGGMACEAGARPRAHEVAASAGRRRLSERRCLWSCRLRWNYEK